MELVGILMTMMLTAVGIGVIVVRLR